MGSNPDYLLKSFLLYFWMSMNQPQTLMRVIQQLRGQNFAIFWMSMNQPQTLIGVIQQLRGQSFAIFCPPPPRWTAFIA